MSKDQLTREQIRVEFERAMSTSSSEPEYGG